MKKEHLEKQIKALNERIEELENELDAEKVDHGKTHSHFHSKDELTRKKIVGLIRCFHCNPVIDFHYKGEVASWEEVFFMIGELKADANYSIVLEEKRQTKTEAEKLKKELNSIYFKK